MRDGGTEATPRAGLPQGESESGTPNATERPATTAKGFARAAKAAAKAERRATRAERRAAKAERRAARAAQKAAARAQKAAAKAERKAAMRATKATAKAERKAAKRIARGPATADRSALQAPEPIAAGAAELQPAAGPDGGQEPSRGIRPARPPRARSTRAGAARTRVPGARAEGVGGASGMLREVADLVRQAAEPAASRIVDRVGRPSGGPSVAEPGVPPEPEPEPAATPGFPPEESVAAGEESAATPEEPAVPPEEPGVSSDGEPADRVAEPLPASPVAEPAVSSDGEPAHRVTEPVPTSPVAEPATTPALQPVKRDLTPAPAPTAIVVAGTAALTAGAVIGAAVDIGANSAHLLVAAAGGHRVEPLLDESVFLGLGDRVTAGGFIGARARQELVSALVTYAATARRMGAREITIVGTEPLRRAADAAALVHAVEVAAGVPLHVLGHDEEAMLTLLGVTMGRPAHTDMLVIDVGGGSCELVLAHRDGTVRATGIALGSARLTQDLVHADPPTLAEIEAMRSVARAALVDLPEASPADMVAVGGTASNLLRLMPSTSLDRVLTRRRITVVLAMLTVQPSADAAERHLIRPQRARILPAGAVIVDAILERYGVDRLRVVEEGIREGAVLAAAIAGPAWRDRLGGLVRGWSESGLPVD